MHATQALPEQYGVVPEQTCTCWVDFEVPQTAEEVPALLHTYEVVSFTTCDPEQYGDPEEAEPQSESELQIVLIIHAAEEQLCVAEQVWTVFVDEIVLQIFEVQE